MANLSFEKTINEKTLGATAAGVMTDCEHYGITHGCTVDCPVLIAGQCELKDNENLDLYRECQEIHG